MSFKLRSLVFAVFMLVFGSALQAHELRPAVMDIGISDDRPGQLAIRLTLSGEAVLAGLDLSGITDTDASDRSAAYDALRALSSADLALRMRAGFADLAADITLRIGGEEAALTLIDVSVIEEAEEWAARAGGWTQGCEIRLETDRIIRTFETLEFRQIRSEIHVHSLEFIENSGN